MGSRLMLLKGMASMVSLSMWNFMIQNFFVIVFVGGGSATY